MVHWSQWKMEKQFYIDKLQDRGKFFVNPNDEIYEGQ
jgi:predicted membrane GTPase involved in stress response